MTRIIQILCTLLLCLLRRACRCRRCPRHFTTSRVRGAGSRVYGPAFADQNFAMIWSRKAILHNSHIIAPDPAYDPAYAGAFSFKGPKTRPQHDASTRFCPQRVVDRIASCRQPGHVCCGGADRSACGALSFNVGCAVRACRVGCAELARCAATQCRFAHNTAQGSGGAISVMQNSAFRCVQCSQLRDIVIASSAYM